MDKSSKAAAKQVGELLAEREQLRRKLAGIETRRERATREATQVYEAAIAPAKERFDTQAAPHRARKAEIEKEIDRLLLGEVKDGVAGVPQVETDTAIAEVLSQSRREVDAKKFYDAVPPSKRTDAFWNCLSVQVTVADKFDSAVTAQVAQKKTTHRVNIREKVKS